VIQPSGLITTVYRAPSGEPTVGAATTQKTVRNVNDQGWTTSVIDALGQTTGYSHDPHGNLLQVSKPGQTAVVMTYDIRGRKKTLVDPDAGSISYSYNSAGDLLAESVSGGRSSSTSYDALGRPLTRTATAEGKTFTTTYGYDGSYANGKLVSESSSTPLGVNTRSWAFDAKSRVTSTTVSLTAPQLAVRSFTTTTAYDANSRVQSITYPQNGNALNALKYEYLNGYFQSAKYNATTIWNTTERFPDQQVKTASLGGLTVARTYDAIGRINTIKTTNASATVLQNATFGFDTLGNLTSRSDTSAGLSENFCYDVLNRVKGSIGSCNTFSYDGAGNVTKPGVALAYTAATNRLSTVDGLGVTYDTGGNVKSDGTRIYSYTPYDVPDRISQGNQWMEFGFTSNGQRAYERDGANTTASGITYFAGPGFFEQDNTIANGVATVSEVREYLATPAGTIGVVVTNSLGSNISLYLQDHLGSNVASVNATTGVVTRSSYDVWGVRSAALDKGNRGYTGHEHLDFGLIHMNGRVYDPRWGRFLQADPIVQDPEDLQSFNRYSYVMNSPLSFIDPSGFSARSFNRFITRFTALHGDFAHSYIDRRWGMRAYNDPYVRVVAGAVAGYFTYGAVSGWAAGLGTVGAGAAGGAAAGFAAAGIQGGNLNSALSAALTGAITGGLLAGISSGAETVGSPTVLAANENPTLAKIYEVMGAATANDVATNAATQHLERIVVEGKWADRIADHFMRNQATYEIIAIQAAQAYMVSRTHSAVIAMPRQSYAGSIRNVNPTGGKQNCANCAIATDATLAGNPASALPGGPTRISVLEQQFGAKFGPAGSIENVKSSLSAAGDGSRGIVFASRGNEVGHVFNAVNQGGVVRLLDGQTGTTASLQGYRSFSLLRTN
jgi:RHS repeat-associated protein